MSSFSDFFKDEIFYPKMLRFLRLAVVFAVCALIWAAIFPHGADAETGSITILDTQSKVFQATQAAAGGTTDWTTIYFDNTDYSVINDIKIENSTLAILTFANSFESTRFTCTAACTGGGWFYYQTGNPNTVKYVFDSGTIFSGPTMNVAFNKNIYNNITVTGASIKDNAQTIGVNRPACVRDSTAAAGFCINFTYTASVSATTTDLYNVTYTGPLFNIQIDKGTIADKWQVMNYLGAQYTIEPTFNLIDTNFTNTYNGIIVDVSLATGAHTTKTINISGTTVPPVPGTGGSGSGQITYNFSNATLGYSYGVDASISAANFSSFTTYYIYAYDTANNPITGFPTSFNTQTYSSGRFWTFSKSGTYTATLKYCNLFDLTCSNTLGILHTLDNATVIIPEATYLYSVTTDKTLYQPGNTIQIIASNPSNKDVWVTAYGETGIITDIAWNVLVPAGQTIGLTKTLPQNMPQGEYTVNMATTQSYYVIVAQAKFNISSPSSTSNTISVLWDESVYLLGKTGRLTTTTNYNASTLTITSPGGTILTYLFPLNSTNYTMITLDEPGLWKARIVDNGNASRYAQANTTVTAGNPTDNETFTSCKSAATYICWDKHQYTQGSAYTISFRLPIVALQTYFPYIQIKNPTNTVIYNQSVNMSFDTGAHLYIGSISGSFTPQATQGVYFARIFASDYLGNSEIKAESATEVIAATPAPTTTKSISQGTNDLLAGNFVTIIIVMLAFAGIGLEFGGFMGSVLGFSSGFIVLSVLNIMPLWALFLFAIISITAFAVFAGKAFTGGGGKD